MLDDVWKIAQRVHRSEDVVAELQVIWSDVRDMHLESSTTTRHDILMRLGHREIPLSTLGEGVYRIFCVAASLAAAKGLHLLVDEIDTGLHYSRLADMWRMVIKSAIDLDVQVFATTHSLDCIRALDEACAHADEYAAEVALFSIDRRMDEAVRYDGKELDVVVRHEIEVR